MNSAGASDHWPKIRVNAGFGISRNGGFTLVEVLAAVVLLALGLLAILTAIQAGRETEKRAICISIARNIAQSEIDAARSIPFTSLDAIGPGYSSPSLPPGNEITVVVSRYPTPTVNYLRRITVTVKWPDGDGTREVCYDTLIARP